MARTRYQVPTHLDIEDKIVAYGPIGLTQRQLFLGLTGLAVGYGLFKTWPGLPPATRALLFAAPLLVIAPFALLRPGGRTLEGLLLLLVRYAATPRVARWGPAPPRPADWRPHGGDWAGAPLGRGWELDVAGEGPVGEATPTGRAEEGR